MPARPERLFRDSDPGPPARAGSDAVQPATGSALVLWARQLGLERLRVLIAGSRTVLQEEAAMIVNRI